MNAIDIFTIIVGILGIVSFVFSIWVWMRSDMKIRELSNIIETVHDIACTVLWEESTLLNESTDTRLKQAEKAAGFVISIMKLTERYAGKKHKYANNPAIDLVIERGIILTNSMIGEIEMSKETKEVWLVTPDFKPDSSDEATGKMVAKCIREGRKYVFFYPDNLQHKDAEIARLLKNIGVGDLSPEKIKENVQLVPLGLSEYKYLFEKGNTVMIYRDEKRRFPPRCFEELTFTRVSERGVFWQEHSEQKSIELRHLLESYYSE